MTRTWFPRWSQTRLEIVARKRAQAIYLARDRFPSDSHDIDRLVVNMLRHEFSNYDDDQGEEAHRLICRAVTAQYKWLSDECDKQIERRARSERQGREYMIMALEHAAAERERRVERSRLSGEVIDTMRVGDVGFARVAGFEHRVTITWVGRRRIEVSYTLKSGANRKPQIYACDFVKSDAIIGGGDKTMFEPPYTAIHQEERSSTPPMSESDS
ncbi:MAG TPA: hypothetical protein VMU68_13190 [Acidimicrobiales bacterium]|nr:hypothetical protein [Acidimicrobiales bacterium]